MATVHRQALFAAGADEVWAALRDVFALHTRLAPGFVVACERDGDARVVTFDTGAVARELIVDVGDEERRVAYAVVASPLGLAHHHATSQVFDEDGRARFVWRADFTPDDRAPVVAEFMERGLKAMAAHFQD